MSSDLFRFHLDVAHSARRNRAAAMEFARIARELSSSDAVRYFIARAREWNRRVVQHTTLAKSPNVTRRAA